MIRITDINGGARYLAPDAIAQVIEAGASTQWHGIKSIIKTFDGKTIEAQDAARDIAQKIEAAMQRSA